MIVENKRYCDDCNSDNSQRYDSNYKVYTELINRLESVKDAIKKQNYGIAMDILCKPYPEFQITASTELEESEDEKIRKALVKLLKECGTDIEFCNTGFTYQEVFALVEKQGKEVIRTEYDKKQDEQKSADKVEPKFKV